MDIERAALIATVDETAASADLATQCRRIAGPGGRVAHILKSSSLPPKVLRCPYEL